MWPDRYRFFIFKVVFKNFKCPSIHLLLLIWGRVVVVVVVFQLLLLDPKAFRQHVVGSTLRSTNWLCLENFQI